MNFFSVPRIFSGISAFVFIGFLPIYYLTARCPVFIFLPGKGMEKKIDEFSVREMAQDCFFVNMPALKKVFILFLSLFTGIYITNVFLIILSLAEIKFNIFSAGIFSLIFFIIFIFIIIYEIRINISAGIIAQKENHKATIHKNSNSCFNMGKTKKIASAVLAALMVFNLFMVAFFTFLFPVRFWDAVSCWSLKAKAFFIDGSILSYYTGHDYVFSHLSYPLYLPLAQTWLYIWIGNADEVLVKAIFPVFYVSLIFIIYYLLSKRINSILSLVFAFILSSLPIIIDHGYIEYTNLLFSIVLFISVYFLYLFLCKNPEEENAASAMLQERFTQQERLTQHEIYTQEEICKQQGRCIQHDRYIQHERCIQQKRYLITSSMFFAILPQIRSEGIIFLAVFLILMFVFLLRNLFLRKHHISAGTPGTGIISLHENSASFKNLILPIILSPIIVVAVLLPWLILKSRLGLPFLSLEWGKLFTDLQEVKTGALIAEPYTFFFTNGFKNIIGELFYSFNDSTRAFFGSSYGIIWVVLFILFLLNIKRIFLNFNWIFALFTGAGFVMVFISLSFIEEFSWSIDRYILHLFPLTYFWILYNLPLFVRNFQTSKNADTRNSTVQGCKLYDIERKL